MTTSTACALTAGQREIHRLLADNQAKDGNGDMKEQMQNCIDACTQCHLACRRVLAALSRRRSGMQVEPSTQVLLECSDLCALSASLQLEQSPYSRRVREICADACRECEHQCMGTAIGEECAQACRVCAESCEAMAA
ncbi:hypothetical protein [Herbaspirillum rhizosphaerae]|uniref:hypothetical protein n=1 Tax=Herbaspirillum rhizosphaerae TaxID=346179 RepID=UPI00067D0276|nr:hypothetical protein [Herbaspirillum rhizosphaerae]